MVNGYAVAGAALAAALVAWPAGQRRVEAAGRRGEAGRRAAAPDSGTGPWRRSMGRWRGHSSAGRGHSRRGGRLELPRARWLRPGLPRIAALAAALAGGCAVAARVVPWQLAIAATMAGSAAAHLLGRARAAAREQRNMDGLTAALRGLIRELKAGAGPIEAANHVRAAAAPAARDVLDLLGGQRWDAGAAGAGDAGVAGGSAGQAATAALPAAVIAQIQQAWAVSAGYGVPLAAMLAACVDDLDDRAALARLRAQHVAGPAVSGYVLAALPVAGIAMGAGLGSKPIDVLLGGTLGGALLVVGVGLSCAGLLWTARIARGAGDD